MTTIASEAELEAFLQVEKKSRKLTDPLKGVVQEIALTGKVRFRWHLLRPLLEVLLEHVLLDFDAGEQLEVGPRRPLPGGETVQQLIERFKGYLADFQSAPWTIQRLCEVLLEPHKQYTKLHKAAMALEKLLLVTSEVEPDFNLPPPPLLSTLGPVNENPAPVYLQLLKEGGVRKRVREDEGMGLVNAALTIKSKAVSAAPELELQLQSNTHQERPYPQPQSNGSFTPALEELPTVPTLPSDSDVASAIPARAGPETAATS